jgi:hypothetical protein
LKPGLYQAPFSCGSGGVNAHRPASVRVQRRTANPPPPPPPPPLYPPLWPWWWLMIEASVKRPSGSAAAAVCTPSAAAPYTHSVAPGTMRAAAAAADIAAAAFVGGSLSVAASKSTFCLEGQAAPGRSRRAKRFHGVGLSLPGVKIGYMDHHTGCHQLGEEGQMRGGG